MIKVWLLEVYIDPRKQPHMLLSAHVYENKNNCIHAATQWGKRGRYTNITELPFIPKRKPKL